MIILQAVTILFSIGNIEFFLDFVGMIQRFGPLKVEQIFNYQDTQILKRFI